MHSEIKWKIGLLYWLSILFEVLFEEVFDIYSFWKEGFKMCLQLLWDPLIKIKDQLNIRPH